jgi:hypothetical protein
LRGNDNAPALDSVSRRITRTHKDDRITGKMQLY